MSAAGAVMGLKEAGIRLRELRQAARLSQAAAAAVIGVHPKTVERWERGETMPEDMIRFKTYIEELHGSFEQIVALINGLSSDEKTALAGQFDRALDEAGISAATPEDVRDLLREFATRFSTVRSRPERRRLLDKLRSYAAGLIAGRQFSEDDE